MAVAFGPREISSKLLCNRAVSHRHTASESRPQHRVSRTIQRKGRENGSKSARESGCVWEWAWGSKPDTPPRSTLATPATSGLQRALLTPAAALSSAPATAEGQCTSTPGDGNSAIVQLVCAHALAGAAVYTSSGCARMLVCARVGVCVCVFVCVWVGGMGHRTASHFACLYVSTCFFRPGIRSTSRSKSTCFFTSVALWSRLCCTVSTATAGRVSDDR